MFTKLFFISNNKFGTCRREEVRSSLEEEKKSHLKFHEREKTAKIHRAESARSS